MVIIGATLVAINPSDLFGGKVSLANGARESFIASILFGLFYWPVNEYITERSHWLSTSIVIKFLSLVIVLLISCILNNTPFFIFFTFIF